MPELLYMEPWLVDYSYEVTPNIIRSSGIGRVSQRGLSQRRIMRAQVRRQLIGLQAPYFEYFINSVLSNGSAKFTDVYADQNGLATGLIRIVDGRYSIDFDGRDAVVSCEIEVFR